MAQLHPQLAQDCLEIAQLPLCRVLLMNDAQYPWLILVPNRDEITEVFQLTEQDQQQLSRESSSIAKALYDSFDADKINIAALGNMVPQLHVHHVVRYKNDVAWPAPIWGKHPAIAYTDEQRQTVINKLKAANIHDISWQV